jgi:hypothetical protein
MLIPAGTNFQVIFQGQTTLTKSPDEILAEMTPYLSNGNLSVQSTSVAASGVLSTISLGAFGSYIATLNLQSANDMDDSQVIALVSQAYNLITKNNVLSVSVPQIGGQQTGQAAPSGVTVGGIGDAVSNFFSSLKSAGASLLIGLAGIVIIVLLIVAYGPNVKHITGAL